MASSIVDDEDLIDLESAGSSCVSRAVMPEGSAEELEHLLDVCPPQLEQKLSLTRKQELVREHTDNGDVLVTLGHDQVVPRRKRIDVVSSETIKRVRDITKNLEPVIQTSLSCGIDVDDGNSFSADKVDGPPTNPHRQNFTDRLEITDETREINNAFDFLTDLDDVVDDDDDDDDDQPPDKRRRRDSPDVTEDHEIVAKKNFYPLEPTCLIEKSSTRYRDIDRSNREIEANDRTSVIDTIDSDEKTENENVNNGYETSPLSNMSRQTDSNRVENSSFSPVFAIERQPRFARLWDDCGMIERGNAGRTSDDRTERKSWSEGGARCLPETSNNVTGFDRSTSIDIERICQPSTSGITTLLRRSSRNIGRRPAEQSASSSECSEVDWSWVEEYESPVGERTPSSSPSIIVSHRSSCRSKSNNNANVGNYDGDGVCSAACSSLRPASAPTRVAPGTPPNVGETDSFANNADGERERMRAAGQTVRDTSASVAMSVGATGKSPPSGTTPGQQLTVSCDLGLVGSASIDYETTFDRDNSNVANVYNDNFSNRRGNVGNVDEATTQSSTRNNNNRTNEVAAPRGNSWVRASMRRIRHLRLPDTDRRNVDVNATASAPILGAPNSLPDIALIAPEIIAAQTNGIGTVNATRPSSAPSATRDNSNRNTVVNPSTPRRGRRNGSRSRITGSQDRTGRSRNESRGNSAIGDNAEIGVQTGNSTTASPAGRRTSNGPPQHPSAPPSAARRVCERQRNADRDNERGEEDDDDDSPLGRWPHPLSPALACLGCTLGLFNISRFAILSIQFGANFIVQFLVLTLVLGIPLLTLQVCLGQRLAAGAVDMWRISPVFHGVGIALLVAQACIGIYSIIGVSWMFVYFRDSFIAKQDRYRWAEPFLHYRDDIKHLHNTSTYKLQETVPDYFSGVVLQRHHMNEPESGVVTLKFQVAFNLAVVWMIVFVSLSKGLRSYGKVVYVFTLVPVFGTLILCTKLLGLTPPGSMHQLFPATVWSEFFVNSKSWVAASSEVFLTWGILGAAAMQIAAHNKHKHLLQRDTSLVVVLTVVVLLLAAFLANTCVQILRHYGYQYTTNSFEKISGYTFMRHVNQPSPSGYSNTPERFMPHASFLLGQRVARPGADLSAESGYQVLRLSTELVPATLAILGTEKVSPFWAVLFYFILILFGIAQQLAIWHCVITGIMAINTKMMKLWETTITFFSCACAYILGLPMATELGIYVVYYLDYTIGGAWWIMILYLVQVAAVFVVRGRPHTGETVVAELFPPTGRCLRHWAGPLLSFTWNVVMPVALMVLSIMTFKSGGFRELYVYRITSRDYWAVWARQFGAVIQLTPILIIPGVAIIQTCRYLNSGPSDIFDRIQLLYRPPLDVDDPGGSQTHYGNDGATSIHGNGILPSSTDVPFEDPPPKYTPPPSYTTATGARIAKMLRQSFRRSVRRIASVLGETSGPRTRPALQPPPPDYATVLVEMNQTILSQNITIHTAEQPQPDVTDTTRTRSYSADRHRSNTIDRTTRISTIDRNFVERTHSTMDRTRRHHNNGTSNLTAADVANLLRSSIRRGAPRNQPELFVNGITDNVATTNAASVENLVNAAAPIGEDSLVYDKNLHLVHDGDNDDDDEKKTVNEMDSSVSVI